jgi:hypothetical protein
MIVVNVGPLLLAAGAFAGHGKGDGWSLTAVLIGFGVMLVILFVLVVLSIMGSRHSPAIRRFGRLFRRRTRPIRE